MSSFLLDIEPHKVSRDLSGYILLVYGEPKIGKSTFGASFPNSLTLAFERGYNAIPGIKAIDITSWSQFKKIVKELKDPEVQAEYSALSIDTVDISAELCQKYICN